MDNHTTDPDRGVLDPVLCPGCGAVIGDAGPGTNPGDDPRELAHYVWAIRYDGSRSNLGYCPVARGLARAHAEARSTWGRSAYWGDLT